MTSRECRELLAHDYASYKRRLKDLVLQYSDFERSTIVGCLYLALAAPRLIHFDRNSLEGLIDRAAPSKDVSDALKRILNDECVPLINTLMHSLSVEELYASILWGVGLEFNILRDPCLDLWSRDLNELVAHALDAKSGDKIADLHAEGGALAVAVFASASDLSITIADDNQQTRDLALLRVSLLDCRSTVVQSVEREAEKYDKAVVHIVPGHCPSTPVVHFDSKGAEHAFLIGGAWRHALKALNLVKDSGTVACLLLESSLRGTRDEEARRYFVDARLLHAVIALPSGVLNQSRDAPYLVLLRRESDSVHFIDATELGRKKGGRKRAEFTTEDFQWLSEQLLNDTEHSRTVSAQEIVARYYALNPHRYLYSVHIPDARPLGEVAMSIVRGAQISGERLEKLQADHPTGIRFLKTRDIAHGRVDGSGDPDPIYLKEIPNRVADLILRDGQVIIARGGVQDIKSAIFEDDGTGKVLANQNVYVVDVDRSKLNPYYLHAFLESEAGRQELQMACSGSLVPIMTGRDLERLEVPVPPIDEQNRIAKQYLELHSRKVSLLKQLSGVEEQMRHVWAPGVGK